MPAFPRDNTHRPREAPKSDPASVLCRLSMSASYAPHPLCQKPCCQKHSIQNNTQPLPSCHQLFLFQKTQFSVIASCLHGIKAVRCPPKGQNQKIGTYSKKVNGIPVLSRYPPAWPEHSASSVHKALKGQTKMRYIKIISSSITSGRCHLLKVPTTSYTGVVRLIIYKQAVPVNTFTVTKTASITASFVKSSAITAPLRITKKRGMVSILP